MLAKLEPFSRLILYGHFVLVLFCVCVCVCQQNFTSQLLSFQRNPQWLLVHINLKLASLANSTNTLAVLTSKGQVLHIPVQQILNYLLIWAKCKLENLFHAFRPTADNFHHWKLVMGDGQSGELIRCYNIWIFWYNINQLVEVNKQAEGRWPPKQTPTLCTLDWGLLKPFHFI